MKNTAGHVKTKVSMALLSALTALALTSISSHAEPTLTGNFSLTSDYLFRGISQTNEGMALQGGLTLTAESGFYVSTWGSNISFGQG